MSSVENTVNRIISAPNWDQRVARIRQIPQHHGTMEHSSIFAAVAEKIYVPYLAADFAYVHKAPFYEQDYFNQVYDAACSATEYFSKHDEVDLQASILKDPRTLLVFRTITGLTKEEFAHATKLVAESIALRPLSANKIDSMEKKGTTTSTVQALLAAKTLCLIMDGKLFGEPPGNFVNKSSKPDTVNGWDSVLLLAKGGVPYSVFLHQRHYGGSFRQVLDATSVQRGDLIEDAVEAMFLDKSIPYIRTGSHNQSEIAERFEVKVTPAPDFVVFDKADKLRAILECKGTNNGGTARDKALRFERLRDESIRLGGVPLIAVLGGMGWARVNDALGPVIRDTEGRVFTLATLAEMLRVSPFPSLAGLASK